MLYVTREVSAATLTPLFSRSRSSSCLSHSADYTLCFTRAVVHGCIRLLFFFNFFGYQTTQSRHAHVFQNFFAVAGRKRWTDHVLRALISRARQRTRRAVISTQHAATIRHIL